MPVLALLLATSYAAPWAVDEAPTLNGLLAAGTADIDDDGFVDLVGLVNGDVAWSRGPAFVEPVVIADVDTLVLGLVDVDGDGDVDFVGGETELAWYENLGGGAIGRAQPTGTTTFERVTRIDVLDLDGDGDEDLLVRDAWNSVFRVENLGGSFGAPVVDAVPVTVVDIGDLTGDGLPDLVVAEEKSITVAPNLGTGFGPTTPACTGYLTPTTIADFDLDGDLDILTGDPETVHWCANRGDGTFDAPVLLEDFGTRVLELGAADLDGDVDPDVLVITLDDRLTLRNNTVGGLSGDVGDPVAPTFNSLSSWLVEDLDGDRAADLVILSNEYGWGGYTTSPLFRFVWNPGFADADGDGLSDDAEARFGTDPYDVDSDGDGVWDYDQLAANPVAVPTEPEDTGVPVMTGDTGHTGSTVPTGLPTDTSSGATTIADTATSGNPRSARPPDAAGGSGGCSGCSAGVAPGVALQGLLTRRRPAR